MSECDLAGCHADGTCCKTRSAWAKNSKEEPLSDQFRLAVSTEIVN